MTTSELRTPPTHPRALEGAARRAYLAARRQAQTLDAVRGALVGDVLKLDVDYGVAYALLVTGRMPRHGRHALKRVALRLTVTAAKSYDRDRIVRGSAAWERFAAPAEVRLSGDNKIRSILVGEQNDFGGMGPGWFVGQIGDLLSAGVYRG